MKRALQTGDRVEVSVRGTVEFINMESDVNGITTNIIVRRPDGRVIHVGADDCTKLDEPERDPLGTVRRITSGIGTGYVVVKIRTKPGSTKTTVWMSLGLARLDGAPVFFSDNQVRDRSEIVTVIDGAG